MRMLTTQDLVPLEARLRRLASSLSDQQANLRNIRLTVLRLLVERFVAHTTAQSEYNTEFSDYVDGRFDSLEDAFNSLDQSKLAAIMGHINQPAKFLEIDTFGGFNLLGTGLVDQVAVTTLTVEKGTGRLIIVVDSGTGLSGDFNVNGDTVDRDTGAVTVSDNEIVHQRGAITVDNSTTDTEGNTIHDITGALITRKWFTGTVVISGLDGAKATIRAFHCSFEQFDDSEGATLDTYDVNIFTNHMNAWMYSYLYHVDVKETLQDVDITLITSISIEQGTAIANRYWRQRRANLNLTIATQRGGLFGNIFVGPSPNQFTEDLEWKLWMRLDRGNEVDLGSPPSAPSVPSGGGSGGGRAPLIPTVPPDE